MKAVILSAGSGTRLRPLTDDRPKGMVAVAGKPIIQWQVEMFRSFGFEDIAIVTGYMAEAVEPFGARLFDNVDHDTTNMVHSLFCAREFLTDGVVVSYGDILYARDVLRAVLDSDGDVSVVVDLEWEPYFAERFGDAYEDAESLLIDDEGAITSIGGPDPGPEEVQAQYIGLVKLTADGVDLLSAIHADATGSDSPIGWGRPPRRAYMTDLLQEAASRGHRLAAVPIRRGWVEVDTPRDLEIARRTVPNLLGAPTPHRSPAGPSSRDHSTGSAADR